LPGEGREGGIRRISSRRGRSRQGDLDGNGQRNLTARFDFQTSDRKIPTSIRDCGLDVVWLVLASLVVPITEGGVGEILRGDDLLVGREDHRGDELGDLEHSRGVGELVVEVDERVEMVVAIVEAVSLGLDQQRGGDVIHLVAGYWSDRDEGRGETH
jgi:hypothetical protein